jgi:hypothetical protein
MRLQRLFPGIALVGVLTLALGSSLPVASAASASTYVTRGQYVEQLLQAVGIQPDNSAVQNFSDVPPSNPYFGYVEAAYKAGITTGMVAPTGSSMGVFGVNQDLNRGEAAAFDLRAYDGGVATYAQNDSVWDAGYNPNNPAYAGQVSFLDYAAIPTALQGDVYTASAIGLLHGFTNGDFGPLQNLTSDQTVHLISQLKSVEAINGAYNWRWIDSNQGTVTEPRSVNAMQFLAYAIQGKPFSAVSSFINQSDAASLQASYAGIQQNWQQDYASKAPGVTWKVIGGGYTDGMSAPANEVMCADQVVLEAETSSGAPVNLATVMGIGGTGGPYIKVMVPDVVTDSNGLVVSIGGTYINNNSNDSVQSGESVAGVVMDLTAGQVAVGDNGMAIAVVGGLGAAFTGNGQTAP